jgi:hypothetical protein
MQDLQADNGGAPPPPSPVGNNNLPHGLDGVSWGY